MPEMIVKLGDNVVQKYFFVKESMSIGRTMDNQIVIENLAISRNHAIIHFDSGKYTVEDMGSSNGTFVNGVRIRKTEILDRDVISIGKHKLYFYHQHAANEVQRPALESNDRTMMMTINDTPQLVVTKGRQKGQRFDVSRLPCTIGRGSANLLRINDWFVSKQHAVIEQRGDDYVIKDLDSWRNTKVNGATIKEAVLKEGDEIQLGPTVLIKFDFPDSALNANLSPRQPVEMQAASAPLAPTRMAMAEAQAPQPAEEDEAVSQSEAVATGAELDAIILAEALGPRNGRNGNGASPTYDAPEAFPEPFLDEASQAALEAQQAQAVFEEAAPACEEPTPDSGQPQEYDFNEEEPFGNQDATPVGAPTSQAPTKDIHMWEKALTNKSPVIRKQAMRQLKKLTGRDYEY